MKLPEHYAVKARILEANALYSSAAVLYRMAANASTLRKDHARAVCRRGNARRCESHFRSAA